MPAGKTYVKVASQTLGSASSSVTFSNLPQNFTDLVLVIQGNFGSAGGSPTFRANSDSSSNYSDTYMYGNGSSAVSGRQTSQTQGALGYMSNAQSNVIAHFMNYSNSSIFKTVISRGNDTNNLVISRVAVWRSTAAITNLEIRQDASQSFQSGTTFNIYGIEAAKSPYAEGGDKVYSTGTHWVHEFYYSGTFVPKTALTCDYLVVAGGGGGGGGTNTYNTRGGGGGGAGGLRCTVTATGGGGSLETALSLSAQTYTVTVGAGGAAGVNGSSAGTSGSNSVFSTITSTGGGGGGRADTDTASTGGSGGGGGTKYNGKAGTANQGYSGGNAPTDSNVGGGGGGASAAGSSGTASPQAGGNGGNGVTTSISGSSVTYAGGGGGAGATPPASTRGAGGTGGGGNGGYHSSASPTGLNATSGTTNTGGGGGGGAVDVYSGLPGAGGSGIVIVRYSI